MDRITLVLFGDGKPQDINPIWRITPMLTAVKAIAGNGMATGVEVNK